MAVTITTADLEGYGIKGPSAMLDDLIAVAGQADVCLDANAVPDATQRLLKVYAIGHLVTQASGGQIKSQSAPSGASRSFSTPTEGTGWLDMLKGMDAHGCLAGLIERQKPAFIAVAGPGRARGR